MVKFKKIISMAAIVGAMAVMAGCSAIASSKSGKTSKTNSSKSVKPTKSTKGVTSTTYATTLDVRNGGQITITSDGHIDAEMWMNYGGEERTDVSVNSGTYKKTSNGIKPNYTSQSKVYEYNGHDNFVANRYATTLDDSDAGQDAKVGYRYVINGDKLTLKYYVDGSYTANGNIVLHKTTTAKATPTASAFDAAQKSADSGASTSSSNGSSSSGKTPTTFDTVDQFAPWIKNHTHGGSNLVVSNAGTSIDDATNQATGAAIKIKLWVNFQPNGTSSDLEGPGVSYALGTDGTVYCDTPQGQGRGWYVDSTLTSELANGTPGNPADSNASDSTSSSSDSDYTDSNDDSDSDTNDDNDDDSDANNGVDTNDDNDNDTDN